MMKDQSHIPNHVAIIMDGNGRWAQERGLKRTEGHREGMEAIRRISAHASDRGVKVLTLYAFSTENWKRPPQEIHVLMKLPIEFFKSFIPELIDRNIKVTMMGMERNVPGPTLKAIKGAIEQTQHCTGMILNFAFNYGGRMEIVEAVKSLVTEIQSGDRSRRQIDEQAIERHLFSQQLAPYSDIDLMIRTSGEQRLSNFLLWQNAYSELYFVKHNWPDFDATILDEAIVSYQERHRRYGGL